MPRKSHLFLRNPIEGKATFKQKSRFPGAGNENPEPPEDNFTPDINIGSFRLSLRNFNEGRVIRINRRNQGLGIGLFVDYIQIEFYGPFNTRDFISIYRNSFGIWPVRFSDFNTIGLFTVVNENLFSAFLDEIQDVVNNGSERLQHSFIKFIKSFSYHDISLRTTFQEDESFYSLDLIDTPELFQNHIRPLEDSMRYYLDNNGIEYIFSPEFNKIDLFNVTKNNIKEIANNFDILHSVQSNMSGVIRPSAVGTPTRSFGFTVGDAPESLITIGVLDTGVSSLTPTNDVVINEHEGYDITATSSRVDNANHGTAVASLVAFGDKLYSEARGEILPDAKILSIKLLDDRNGPLSDLEVVRLIRQAHAEYGIKIFNLCICYTTPKELNSPISKYAYMLDKLSYELDLLIFISIGNNMPINCIELDPRGRRQPMVYPNQFRTYDAILMAPAESMNNITVGAASGNLEEYDNVNSINQHEDFPAYYTTRHHIVWNADNNAHKNTKLFKPELICYGGDYDNHPDFITDNCGLKIISTEEGIFYSKSAGTSFSTPLACNIAARIINTYPELINNIQTIKALIINSCTYSNVLYEQIKGYNICRPEQLVGNGIPNIERCLYSDENRATLILEDEIQPGNVQCYKLSLPAYLKNIDRKTALKISATLCYNFNPIYNNSLTYCPLHIAFGFFKNIPLTSENKDEKQINGDKIAESSLTGKGWSQDYYYKNKLLSNVQKVQLSVLKESIVSEDGLVKVAITSSYNKLLSQDEKNAYNSPHKFSLVLEIEDQSGSQRLFDELIAENELELITNLEMEAEIENELGNEIQLNLF